MASTLEFELLKLACIYALCVFMVLIRTCVGHLEVQIATDFWKKPAEFVPTKSVKNIQGPRPVVLPNSYSYERVKAVLAVV